MYAWFFMVGCVDVDCAVSDDGGGGLKRHLLGIKKINVKKTKSNLTLSDLAMSRSLRFLNIVSHKGV